MKGFQSLFYFLYWMEANFCAQAIIRCKELARQIPWYKKTEQRCWWLLFHSIKTPGLWYWNFQWSGTKYLNSIGLLTGQSDKEQASQHPAFPTHPPTQGFLFSWKKKKENISGQATTWFLLIISTIIYSQRKKKKRQATDSVKSAFSVRKFLPWKQLQKTKIDSVKLAFPFRKLLA